MDKIEVGDTIVVVRGNDGLMMGCLDPYSYFWVGDVGTVSEVQGSGYRVQFTKQTCKVGAGLWWIDKENAERVLPVGTLKEIYILNKAAAKEYAVATQWPNKKPLHPGWLDRYYSGVEMRVVADTMLGIERSTRFDPMTMRAAEIFDVKPSDVSRRQREYAKQLSYAENYGGKV